MSDEKVKDVVVESPKETLSDMDKMQLELAKSRRQTVLVQAEKALSDNQAAELAFKYVVLQLYMKYHMTEADAINEQGEILRGGAAAAQQEQLTKQQGK